MPTAIRTCPLCEATCGLEVTVGDERCPARPRRRRGRLLPRLPVPEGRRPQGAARGPRPAAHAAGARRATASSSPATWDEAFAVIAERLPPILAEHGRDAVARVPRQPERRTASRRCSTAACCSRRCGSRTSSRPAPSTSTPSRWPRRCMFGSGASVAGARPRPHRPPADARREPAGLERLADDRARRRAAACAAIRARGGKVVVVDPRRTRTAKRRRRAPVHPPGHRRAAAHGARPRAVRRGPRRARSRASSLDGRRRGRARWPRTSRPRRSRRDRRDPGRRRSRRMARELARGADAPRSTGASARRRRRFGTTASWLVDVLNVLTGNLDRPGGAMFPLPRARANARRAGPRPRRALRALGQPRARAPRDLRRAAGRLPGRGDRDAGRGPGPRAASRSPATRSCRRRTPSG